MDGFKKALKKFYLFDFLQSLLKWRRIPLVIYLIIDSFFIFIAMMIVGHLIFASGSESIPENFTTICGIVSAVIYFGAMALSLSPIGEAFLRKKLKCKPVTDKYILERMKPLFDEVYERAKERDASISDNVKLFIQDDENANAFATGRCTVCFTRGLLDYSDEQIKAVLGHEFGHLAHNDTDLTLVVNIANTFIHLIFLGIWAVLMVVKIIGNLFTIALAGLGDDWVSLVSGLFNGFIHIVSFICIRLVESLWNIIGNLLIQFSSRGAEFNADEFAQELGYGDGLISFFETLPDASVGERTPLKLIISKMSTIGASHPETWRRIDHLNKKRAELEAA